MTCVETLKRYEAEAAAVNNDVAVRVAERQKYIAELKQELTDLKGAEVGSTAQCLRYVYKTFPLKNPDHKLDAANLEDRTRLKKTLLTAIQHYHPDKQDVETHGRKWAVLCEEITKTLNKRYEIYKFVYESEATA